MDLFGSLLSAGSNILGGLLSSNNASNALAAQQRMNDQNVALQKDFATHGLTWRAQDARMAESATGLNPLALLGSPTSSFSNLTGSFPTDTSMGSGVAAAGQDLGRAANALSDSNVRKAQLSEKLLEAQIANVNSDTVKNQASASSMVTRTPGTPGVNGAVEPLYTKFRDDRGNDVWLPSGKASSSLQNWASFPQNLSVGGHLLLKNLGIPDMYDSARSWISSHGAMPVRGDVSRSADSTYNMLTYP